MKRIFDIAFRGSMPRMAGKTYYRYIDTDGAAHYVDAAAEIPKSHKGAIHELTIHDDGSAKAHTYVSDALAAMHWPSFAMGVAVGVLVLMIIRFFTSKKFIFAGIATAVAVSSFGGAQLLPKITGVPKALTQYLPASVQGLPSLGEARKIIESLPQASANRDKALEAIFASEQK
jgi:hypothetical protein